MSKGPGPRLEDLRLKKFLETVSKADVISIEAMQEFYKLVRDQALTDASDYLIKFGNTVHQGMRRESPGTAKKIRQLFYGCASTIRADGSPAEELVGQMVTSMKEEPIHPLRQALIDMHQTPDEEAQ